LNQHDKNRGKLPPSLMSAELKPHLRLEIAHVLFIDIVGYSRLLIDEQKELLQELNEIVRQTEQVRAAGAEGKLVRLPTGDGMALVFSNNPEAPVECALEISKALQNHPEIKLRMGIHSGAVNQIADVNDRSNVAGAGINIAQRVMDCGDAGHILLSKHVAEDLAQYRRWQPYLHDLGECEVKHGIRVSVVNLYTEEVGNPATPEKFSRLPAVEAAVSAATKLTSKPAVPRWLLIVAAVLVLGALAIGLLLFQSKRSPMTASTSTAIPEKSIAVLPFENLSANQENAFFTDGVQDEILTELAKIADLKVISRTSVMQYKSGVARNLREIGQQLGVAHLLEGSVQRVGGKVRVNAQLIDARTDGHLWAENYDRPLADVFAIQSEIAKTIADQLQAKLSPREKAAIAKPPTTDLTAYDLYLRAQALFADVTDVIHAKEKLPQAEHVLNEAVARDPHFLLAWCLLARVHDEIYWQGHDHTPGRLDLANAAVRTALRPQPDAGEAHLALADYYYHGFRDYERARSELAIARRTLPNNAEVFEYTGYIDRREGHWEEATRNLERALELDPRNFFTLQQMALTYQELRHYADQARTYDRALTIVPGDPLTRMARALVALDWRADIKPFQTTLATLIAEDPSVAPDVDDPNFALCEGTPVAAARALANSPRQGVVINGVNYPHAYWEGVVARWQGDSAKAQAAFTAARSEVEKIVEKQPDFAAALSLLGMIDAGLGRKEEALREGRRACELLPISKDSTDGAAFAVNLAQIYAWTGEKDRAIEQIEAVERVPNYLSYGLLKLHPYWDSLRGDPRFEKIVASLAPKDAK
jgi:TolB-like protein/class 3 adenylate cyclase/Flp pilus assembly protein TadD